MNGLITATEALSKLYGPLFVEDAPNWVRKNELVLNYARKSNLVVGGSIAMAITRKKVVKIPGDLDFFTNDNEDAMYFLTAMMYYLHKKPGSHYRIFVNNQTKFTLPGVISHYRLEGPPYWLPICVMVIEKPIRYFAWHGLRVQFFDDVVAAAKDVTKRDGKERVDVEPIVWKDAHKKTITMDFADDFDFPDVLCGESSDAKCFS
jgi:hypothetical protein